MTVRAPLRFCAQPGCSARVPRGYCAQHRRPSTARLPRPLTDLTYNNPRWRRFRAVEYPDMLLERGKLPTCGARLADGPSPHSRCAALGRLNAERLHLDHDPPLAAWERSQPHLVCDPHRVAFLCISCHAARTNRDRTR